MDTPTAHLAIELTPSFGHGVLGILHQSAHGPTLRIVHSERFENRPMVQAADLLWDVESVRRGIITCLRSAARRAAAEGSTLRSLGVTSFNADFALLDRSGLMVAPPRRDADPRHAQALQHLDDELRPAARFALSGVAPRPTTTLAQLRAMRSESPGLFARAESLSLIPDLLHGMLTESRLNERSAASASELFDQRTDTWSQTLLALAGLAPSAVLPLTPPASRIGPLVRDIAGRAGIDAPVDVVVPPSIDLASAVAALPPTRGPRAFIHLADTMFVGIEQPRDVPIDHSRAFAAGLSSVRGLGSSVLWFRALPGLGILHALRREWRARGRSFSLAQLAALLGTGPGPGSCPVIDLEHPDFALSTPGAAGLPASARLNHHLHRAGHPAIAAPADCTRAILSAIGTLAARALKDVGEITAARPTEVHFLGEAASDRALATFLVTTLDRPCVVGPPNAAAVGNLLSQCLGLGLIADPAELARTAARSFDCPTIPPRAATGH
ncbi:MAG: FGGY family carbohydrate kinase [Phycisphaerales bacterium]